MGFGCLRRQQLICRLSRQQFRKGLVLLQSNGQSKAKLTRPHERPHNAFYTAAARGAGTAAVAAAAAAAAAQGSTPTTRLKPLAAAGPNGTLAPRPRPQTAEDAFYAEQATTFADLGIVQAVADALQAAGFTRPSRVQVTRASGGCRELTTVHAAVDAFSLAWYGMSAADYLQMVPRCWCMGLNDQLLLAALAQP